MTAWLAIRLVKLFAVALAAAGSGAVFARTDREARLRVAYTVVVPAFVASWLAGYALMKFTQRGLGEPWILGAMASSVAGLHAVLLGAHRPAPRAATGALAVGCAAATLALMVLRPMSATAWPTALVPAALGAALAWPLWRPPAYRTDPADDALAERAIDWVGRAEGVTFLTLLVVAVVRRIPGVFVHPEAAAYLGWVHGALVLVYLQALVAGGRALGWSARTGAVGILAAFVPLGPVAFEWWRARR